MHCDKTVTAISAVNEMKRRKIDWKMWFEQIEMENKKAFLV